jgi:hypothetical protein
LLFSKTRLVLIIIHGYEFSKNILASDTNITPHTNNEIAPWYWNCQNFLNTNCPSLVSKCSEDLYNKTNLICTKYDFPVILWWLHCFQPQGNDRAQPSWDWNVTRLPN